MSEIPQELRPEETPAPAPARSPKPFWLDMHAWLRDIFLSVALAAIVIVFLYQPVKVEGTSMLPWLQDQQRIFVNKFVYAYGEIERGDVIVFRFPLDPTKSYIKRVVGVPGDHVEITDGVLYINGDRVEENYVAPEFEDHGSHPGLDVPDGHFYVLGDHRNTSNDSRIWGTVPREFITGKAVFAYWPLDRFGSLR